MILLGDLTLATRTHDWSGLLPYPTTICGTSDGEALDEMFEVGPNRFNEVGAISALQFLIQVTTPPADLSA